MKIGYGLDDLFNKYNIVLNGDERIYVQSLTERDYNLESTTPFCLVIDNFLELREKAWTRIVKGVAKYLQTNYPLPLDELYEYRTEWSKAAVFGPDKFLDNCEKVCEDLYVSVNFTALHSLWFIQDLLKLYKIDLSSCYLMIHRSPIAEPLEVQEAIRKVVKNSFTNYLIETKGKDKEKALKIVDNFKYLNAVLSKITRSYYDFFLLDSALILSIYKSKLLQEYRKYVIWNDKQLASVKRYLDYFTDFHTEIKKILSKMKHHLTSISANGKVIEFESLLSKEE